MGVKISVCITTFNRAAALDRTLTSVAEQTRIPDEVIVVDDCSFDRTPAVAEAWANRLPGFQYIRNATNLNMPGNLNVAVGHASGTYIANLHDADTFAPALLEQWQRALDAYPSAGFVFCGIGGWPHRTRNRNGVILHDVEPLTPGRVFYETHLVHRFSCIVWGTVMARRSAYDVLLPFDPQFGFISDVDMWMRMCLHFDVAYVREPLITLDHTPTAERHGDVNWQWVAATRRIQLANLVRFYGNDPDRLELEYIRHQRAARRYLRRRLAGRVRHLDWHGIRQAHLLWKEWKRSSLRPRAPGHA